MGKSSKQKQRVVDYFMSMHFGICLATPNTRLRKILIGEKVAWSGDESQQVTFTVNQPDLFGGVQKEGGVKGTIDYLPGKSDQVLSPQLAARLGGTPSTVPGFRGITSIFFTGLQTLAFSPNFRNPGRLGYAANQALANADAANYNNGAYGSYSTTSATQSGGFKWSSNNPIIQSVWCQVTSIPETLSTQYAAIGDHANPAHIIYEALVDTDFGGNIAPSQINTAMFNAAAQTLYNENFGLSLIWTGQSSVEDFVKEILDHIQATLYINPKNGLFELKLLRADYIEANLRVLNVYNSFVTDDQRKFWGETANEIVVSWTNPENEQTETVIEQDLANIANQGAVVSTSKNYYGVRTKELAKTLAQRDLRQSAYPLASVTLKADRSCWDIVPGEVVKVDHSSDSISPMIMRVLTVDYGKIGSGNIIISLLEDIFSLNVARPITPPGSLYDPNAEEPAAITNYKIFTPPAHWLMKNDPTALKKLTAGESLVGVLGYSSQKTATSFNLAVQSTDTLGNQYWQIGDRKNLTGLGSLSTALAIENSSLIDKLPKTGAFAPNQGDWLILGDDLSEICLVGALETNGWRIYRGMLDTIPKNWSIGSPFRLVPANLNVLDTIHERAVNETCNYMLLTNTEGGQLSTGVAPVSTGVASDRLLRPIRPANVQINGLSTSSIAVSPTGNMTITWANRNRYSEEVTPLKFTDGAVTPEYKQRTLIRVKTTAGVLIREYVHLWNDNTYIIPCSWYAKYASVIVEVLSERYGYESLSKYSYTITGLANNAGASDPPAATAAGTPPPGFNGAGEPVSWEDLIDTDGTKPDDNATVGGTIGTDIRFPDQSIPNQSRLDNTQQQWTDVNNRPTTLAALDSAANTLVTGLNTEVTNARNGAATLLAAVQAAAQTATYNLVTGVPTQTSGTAAPTASAPNGSIYRQTDGTNTILIWVREGGQWKADYNAKSNYDSLNTTVGGHTTSINNLNTTTTNQATSITNLYAKVDYKPNLLKNPSGSLGLDYWTKASGTNIGYSAGQGGEGPYWVNTDATQANWVYYYQDVPVYASAAYSLQASVYALGLTSLGKAKVSIEWRTASANNGWAGELSVVGGTSGWNNLTLPNQIAPANTTIARVYMATENVSAGNYTATNIGWRKIKLEQNTSCTMYSDDESQGAVNTQLQQAKADIATVQSTKIDSTGAQALINTSLNTVFGAGTSGQTNALANYLTTANAAATYATVSALNTVDAKFANYLTTANASSTYLTQANAGTTYATIATTNNLSSNFANYYTKTQSDSNYYSRTYSDATYATAANLTTLQSSVNNAFAVIPTNSPTPKSWTSSDQATQVAASDLSQTIIDNGNVATGGTYALKSMIPLNPTRVYEVEAVIQIMAGNGQIGVNLTAFNNDETASPSGGNWSICSNWVTYGAGTYTMRGRYKSNGTFGTHTVNGNVITWSGQQPWTNPSTSAKGRVGIWYGNGDASFKTKPISLKITDVTDVAGAEANITSLAATEATHYSSLATLTTNLTAKASAGQYQNQNAGFDIYTNATGVPDMWADWSNGSFASRVSDGNGGYAMQLYSNGGDNVGIYQNTSIPANTPIIFYAKVKLNSGTFVGAGVWCDYATVGLSFSSETNAEGIAVGNGTIGQVYEFSKLTRTTQASSVFYAMTHWTNFVSVSAANNITWYECGWRYATQAEIQANKALNDPLGTGVTLSAAITNEQIARANADTANANAIATVSAKLDVAPNLMPYPRPKNLTDAPSSYGWFADIWAGSGAFNVNYAAGDSYWKGAFYYIERFQANAAAAVRIARFDLEPLKCGFGAIYTNKPITVSARAYMATVAGDSASVWLLVLDNSNNVVAYADTAGLPINNSIGYDKRQSWTFNFSSLPQNPIPANAYKLALVFRHDLSATGSSPPHQFLGFTDIKVEFGSVATAYTIEGNNAVIQAQTTILQSTMANVKGELEAKIALTADANGTVTGIEIISVDGTNTPLSKIKFTAAKAEFSGDVLVDGTLTASKIVDNSIGSQKIADGSIGNVQSWRTANSYQPTANNTWYNVGSLPITATGKLIKVEFGCFGWANTLISSNANNGIMVRVRRDNTTLFENGIGAANIVTVGEVQFVQEYNNGFSFAVLDIPAAGVHTYYLDILANNKDYAGISYPYIILQEFIKL